jgi:hypothetical protein
MCVYKHVGTISKICCDLVKYEKYFLLMYRDSLSVLIVGGRCTGTFGSHCMGKYSDNEQICMEILTDKHVFRPPEYEQVVSRMPSIHMCEYVCIVYRPVAKR